MCKGLRITTLTALIIFLALTMVPVVYAVGNTQTSSYDGVTVRTTADVVDGQFTLTGVNESGKKLKIWIRKDNNVGRFYDVANRSDINETITLVDGTGSYNIFVMIQTSGDRYSYGPYLTINNVGTKKIVEHQKIIESKVEHQEVIYNTIESKVEHQELSYNTIESKVENNFTLPSKDIDSNNKEIVELSKRLTQGKKTDSEKIEAINSWVVENISYDYQKYNRMLAKDFSGQYGSVSALQSKKGVCYDYATLFAALCRAGGLEAKVAKGYSTNIIGYHAWNEVYDAEKNSWIILDTTVDSVKHHKWGNKSNVNIRSEAEYYKTEEM